MSYIFRLRRDMPQGFVNNPRYPELPAATKFLKSLNRKEYQSKADLEGDLADFPAYLEKNKVPASPDKPLRDGFRFHGPTNFEGVENVVLISAEVNHCWFGSFGTPQRVEAYFDAQEEARFRSMSDEEW